MLINLFLLEHKTLGGLSTIIEVIQASKIELPIAIGLVVLVFLVEVVRDSDIAEGDLVAVVLDCFVELGGQQG